MKQTISLHLPQIIRNCSVALVLIVWLPSNSKVFGQCQGFEVVVSAPPTFTFCVGDMITATSTVSGGTGPYTYSWSTGGTGPDETIIAQPGLIDFSVTVTDANGCVAFSNTVYVKNMFAHTEFVLSNPWLCEGQGGTEIELEEVPTGSIYVWSTGETTSSIHVSTTGNYSVTVTAPSGCSAEMDITLNFYQPPDAIIDGPANLCVGNNGVLSVLGEPYYLYDWLPGGENTPTILINEPGVYSVVVTDFNGCTSEDEIEIVPFLTPPPILDAPAFLCPENLGTVSITNAQDYVAFNWSNGQTTTSIVGFPGSIYDVTVTEANGCTEIGSTYIGIFDVFTPLISGASELCEGQDSVTFTCQPPFETYLWSTSETTQTISVTEADHFFVTVTDVYGCTSTGDFILNAAPIPEPSVLSAVIPCSGDPAVLAVNGGPYSTYEWSNGATDSTIFVSQPGSYTVTVSNASGCKADTSSIVTSAQGFTANILPAPYDCSGTVTLVGAGGSSYEWSNGDTTSTTTVQTSGTYVVTVTGVSGCTGTAETEVAVPGLPQVSILGSSTLCTGGSAELEASGGYSQYLWSGGETTPILTVSQAGVYTVTVTDANGCTATADQAVAVSPSPEPELMGPAGICENGTATLGLAQPFLQMAWSNGENAQSITVTQPSTYTVTVTDATGCTGTGELVITDYPSPLVDITGPSSICNGGEATLSVSDNFSQIIWNTGETTNSINVSEADLYSVVVVDVNGCTSEAYLEVETGSSLSPSVFSLGNACDGEVTLEVGSSYDDYIWSNGETTPAITVVADGDYTVTVSDVFGCTGVETVTVSIPAPPQVGISGPTTACEGETTSMVAGAGFVSYEWSDGSTTNSIDILQSGTYDVTATDANGCTATASQEFNYFPAPSVLINGPTSICTGNSAQLGISGNFQAINWSNGASTNDITVSQPGIYTVVVTDANGCTASTEHELEVGTSLSPVINATDISCDGFAFLNAGGGYASYIWSNGETGPNILVDADGMYAVTVSDGAGCTGETVLTINLPAPPLVDITGSTSVCTGGTAEFSVPDNFTQIEWSTGETTFAIMVSTTGNYTVTVTDANGCTATAEQSLDVSGSLSVDIETTAEGCDSTVSLAAGVGYTNYLWSDGSTDPTLTIIAEGMYAVTVSDDSGCTGVASVDVVLPDLPEVNISGAQTLCEGDETVLATSGNFVQYLWSTGEMTPMISVTEVGGYSVTVTDADGCTDTDEWTLTELPTDSTFVQIEVCSAQDTGVVEILLTNQFGCDSVLVVNATLAAEFYTELSLTACPGGFAEFNGMQVAAGATEEFIYNASNGCDSVVSVTVSELPAVAVDLSTTPSCPNSADGSIQVSVQGSTPPFQFAVNNGGFQPSPTFADLPSGQYVVLVSDANGCVSEQPVNIGKLAPTVIQLDADDLTCDNTVVTLQPEVLAGNFTNIQWLWNEGSTTPFLMVNQPGQYSVQADDGCEVQELQVNVQFTNDRAGQSLFYIPNSFSPNGDGFNDEFKAYPGQDFTLLSFEFKVFDRWGDMVFGTVDMASGWDGIFRGMQMQPGVYGWYVKAKVELCGGQETDFYQEGGVTIIR